MSSDKSGVSPLGKSRAPRGFLFRFSVLFCGSREAVRLALTLWIISHLAALVKKNFYRRVSDLKTSRHSLDTTDYIISRRVCQEQIWRSVKFSVPVRFGLPVPFSMCPLYHLFPDLSTCICDFFKICLICFCFQVFRGETICFDLLNVLKTWNSSEER